MKKPVVDYREFRLNKLNTEEFSHLKWLVFWPLFGLVFTYAERGFKPEKWNMIYCALDDEIAFCEWFLIPYLYWFVFLIGMLVYTLLYDPKAFRKMMMFITITYTVALVFFFIYPSKQGLRPMHFENDNILTRFIAKFYKFDTNTNCFPSIHVLGSVAAGATGLSMERFKSVGWRIYFITSTTLISISTVFIKQHSILDIFCAVGVCAVAYFICFGNFKIKKKSPEFATKA